jgi:hypothetical protein
MLCANIPLYKITNIEFRSFLEKYTLQDIPMESTPLSTSIVTMEKILPEKKFGSL